MKSDVKKKMMSHASSDATPKSPRRACEQVSWCAEKNAGTVRGESALYTPSSRCMGEKSEIGSLSIRRQTPFAKSEALPDASIYN
jgi:hypothetical protein